MQRYLSVAVSLLLLGIQKNSPHSELEFFLVSTMKEAYQTPLSIPTIIL